jgi:pyruvate kinase
VTRSRFNLIPAERAVKIVCTLGPASSAAETLRAMVRAGMNVARLNFSHGTREEHRTRAEQLRAVAAEEGRLVAVLQDLRGPKVRIGPMQDGTQLAPGARFWLRRGPGRGDSRGAWVDDPVFFEEVQPGDRLLLADGGVELVVSSATASGAVCEVAAGGPLPGGKGVNAPRGLSRRPILSERDRSDLAFGVELGVDLVSVSYVRNAEDLRTVRRELRQHGAGTPLVAKVETAAAVGNLDSILDATDAVMLARGDLALETPFERVPIEQKRILEAARRRGRPVITATQLLASMVTQPRPTRAEVNDVANAVLDGSDALMLSEETALGSRASSAVGTMARIAAVTEAASEAATRGAEGLSPELREIGVVAEAAARTARALQARAFVVWTRGGLAARLLARAWHGVPILAPTDSAAAARQLAVVRGVFPILTDGPEVDPAAVRQALGAQAGAEGALVLFGHDLGAHGRRLAWLRTARLEEPSSWRRDPSR